jgi:hypothetical protein
MPTVNGPHLPADLPDASPDAVRSLYAELLEADDSGASSNDWTQIVDDWFTTQGFPTILYRAQR